MTGARFDEVEVRRVGLRKPFPGEFRARLVGQTVVTLSRRAKYLLAALASADVLDDAPRHVGVVQRRGARTARRPCIQPLDDARSCRLHMSSGAIITFTDPRRFGVMDLLTPFPAIPLGARSRRPAFVAHLFGTPVCAFFGLDVIVSAIVLWMFVYAEGTRRRMNRLWAPVVASLLVGVSLGLPLFLYMRERQTTRTA